VSALALAYFFHINFTAKVENCNKTYEVLPVLNIRKQDLPLKTEIVYFLKQNNIDPKKIICFDEVDKTILDSSYYVLVDHHVSAFRKQVLLVIDHRPFDAQSNLPESCKTIINQVGSCVTLVFDLINKSTEDDVQKLYKDYNSILNLIYGTIILDTVNFSKTADKARPMDVDAVELIEKNLQFKDTATARAMVFDNLVEARADVGSLDSLQILSKDMKLLKNDKNGKCVAIPGYPILVQEYINMLNAEVSVKQFCDSLSCDVIVLMGMKIAKDKVRRDIGIINIKDTKLFEKVGFNCIPNKF
jgi:exopolyphosphatase